MRHRNTTRRAKDTLSTMRQKIILYDITEDKDTRHATIYAYGPGSAARIIRGDVNLIRVAEKR